MNEQQFKDYFLYSTTENKTICLVEGCTKSYTGYHTTNLWRHLKTEHKEIHDRLFPSRRKVQANKTKDDVTAEIRKGLVELCTINGRPLSIVEDSGIKRILGQVYANETANGAAIDNCRKHIFTRKNVIMDIDRSAAKIKRGIAQELETEVVSLIVHIATKGGKSILGIAIQFVVDDKITIRYLGMKRMIGSHTGAYIAQIVLETLAEYNISLNQIYALTTDNGSNVLKSISILRNKCQQNSAANDNDEGSNELTQCEIDQFSNLFDSNIEMEQTDNRDTQEIMDDENSAEEMLDAFSQIFLAANEDIQFMISQPCGAHSLQLEVNGPIITWETDTGLLTKCRNLVSKLLTPNIRDEFVKANMNLPFHDCLTRWNTIYLMVGTAIFKFKCIWNL